MLQASSSDFDPERSSSCQISPYRTIPMPSHDGKGLGPIPGAHLKWVPIDPDQRRDARRHVTLCLIIARQGENNMTRNAKLLGLIVTAALFTAAPLSLHYSPAKVLSVSLDGAEARVGRPLTPMSVAGVNRRVHRRAYYGAAAGAAAYGAYGYRRACGYAPYPPCY